MKTLRLLFTIIIGLILLSGCYTSVHNAGQETALPDWEDVLSNQIQLLGHRNWIVVVDAAYPLQSSPGVTTVLSDKGHLETIEMVMATINDQQHIKPILYLDKEIDFVDEKSANGINQFRDSLIHILGNAASQKVLHEQLIARLDEASKQFNVLIIKTDFLLPYTSVFFELDCKYWNSEAEQELRKALETGKTVLVD